MTVKAGGRRGQKFRAAVAVAAALLGGARTARAHPELSALGTNRYVTAAIFDDRIDVTDALLEGTLTSAGERRRLDADGDGHIADVELRVGQERLRAEGPAVAIELDGNPLVATLAVTIELGDDPEADAGPLAIERRLSFPGAWTSGDHSLRLTVTREPPRLLETELGVVLGPGVSLRGGADRETFHGPRVSALQARTAMFALSGTPTAARPTARATRRWFAGAGTLVLVVATALGARLVRRRGRSARA